jgi:hypothetical protein
MADVAEDVGSDNGLWADEDDQVVSTGWFTYVSMNASSMLKISLTARSDPLEGGSPSDLA